MHGGEDGRAFTPHNSATPNCTRDRGRGQSVPCMSSRGRRCSAHQTRHTTLCPHPQLLHPPFGLRGLQGTIPSKRKPDRSVLVFFFFFCACLLDSKPPEYGAERQGLPAYLSKKRKQREQEKLQTGSRVDWRGFRRNLNAHTWSPARQDFDSHSLSEAGFGFDFLFFWNGGRGAGVTLLLLASLGPTRQGTHP